MAETPPIFAAVADWVAARPLGCPAAAALTDVLHALTGPPRTALTTLDAAAQPELAAVAAEFGCARPAWPVVGAGVDAVVLVHPGPLPPGTAARLACGPQLFCVVDSAAEARAALAAGVDPAALLATRARILAGELRALAHRLPRLAAPLQELASLSPGEIDDARGAGAAGSVTASVAGGAAVAVAGPDAQACRRVAARLRAGGVEVAGPGAAVLVAVAPPGGWTPADHAALAAAGEGRAVYSTAALPAGVPGEHVAEGDLVARLAAPLPPAPDGRAWRTAAGVVTRRRLAGLDRELVRALAAGDPESGHRILAGVASEARSGVPARREAELRGALGEALLVALPAAVGAGLAVGRTLGAGAGVLAAVLAGLLIGAVRGLTAHRRRGRAGLVRAVEDLRARARSTGPAASTGPAGPAGAGVRWLRRRGTGVTGGGAG
ncbi:hypothetical protein CFRA_10905 [Corynebacterium frankenforstense DSM 45800]|uniref:Uncharacterized protein n=1 Tax=Corynebacterium frankenforstense DSM 45800 TaxID=1437875 RepID=A0A1L7CV19_9CORY|nr:hypothetical protein [Corynebacterium frankenforstense]APT89651.1 hypothetical protein CFRA_10905 [Corynebacterium frankenforstense DSM 45800]